MVVLLGASGYVGGRFTRFFRNQRVDFFGPSRAEIDYTQPEVLRKLLKEKRPDFVINAAGFTGKPNVDACEVQRAETIFGNVVVPLRIGEVCAELGIRWGHVSSGCIYQGDKGVDSNGRVLGFCEEDAPNFCFEHRPCSFYSGSKAHAEEWLLKQQPASDVYIWRMRVPFDSHDSARNYLSKLMRYQTLLNVRNSLSHLDDYVEACWQTMTRNLPTGVYNLTNPGSVMTEEVVALIRREGESRLGRREREGAGTMLKEFCFFESLESFMKIVKTPRSNCVLDTSKAERYGLPMRPIEQALRETLERWEWEAKS